MKKYILILLSTFAFAQTNTTTVGSLKLNNTPGTATTNTKALVRNPSTKLIEEQLFTSTTPSWNQTLTVNSTASQNVTIVDPYNLYLRSGHLKLWHNIDADYADINIGSGEWTFNNSQFDDFKINLHGFVTYKNGVYNGFFDNDDLTASHTYKIPNIDGTLLTNSGTEATKPLTGEYEVTEGGNNFWIKGPDYPNDKNSLLFSEGGVNLDYTNTSTGYSNGIQSGNGGVTLYNTNPAGKGLSGNQDYSANVTSLDFPQVSYIDKRFAGYKETGTATSGNLTVNIGDVEEVNNGTKLTIDDATEVISTSGAFTSNGTFSSMGYFRMAKGAGFATFTNTSTANRNIDIPTEAGKLALESKMVSKTTTQINALTGMVAGDYYFNTTLGTICFYDGTAWKKVTNSAM